LPLAKILFDIILRAVMAAVV